MSDMMMTNISFVCSCLLDSGLSIIMLLLTFFNGINQPDTLKYTIPLLVVHIINFIVNLRTKYKYTVIPIIIKLLGFLYIPVLDVVNDEFNMNLIIFECFLLIGSFSMHIIHGVYQRSEAKEYTYTPTTNQPEQTTTPYSTPLNSDFVEECFVHGTNEQQTYPQQNGENIDKGKEIN